MGRCASRPFWLAFARLLARERPHGQVPEMSDGSWSDPQRDRPLSVRPRLDVIDDQRRLLVPVHVETGTIATDFDLHPGPYSGHEVHIRFIPGRRLFAKSRPGPVRM